MKQLLALLLFVPSLCLAQVPDYVPTEGLVAWYPFIGNVLSLMSPSLCLLKALKQITLSAVFATSLKICKFQSATTLLVETAGKLG